MKGDTKEETGQSQWVMEHSRWCQRKRFRNLPPCDPLQKGIGPQEDTKHFTHSDHEEICLNRLDIIR